MPLIKPTREIEKVNIRARISKTLDEEVRAYMEWAKIKKIDSFIQQAIEHILLIDKDWRDYKKSDKLSVNY